MPKGNANPVTPQDPKIDQVQAVLRTLRVPHHWGGPLGQGPYPDIIGILPPSGRLFLLKIVAAADHPTAEQAAFLQGHAAAGALAFIVDGPLGVLVRLGHEGYEPAAAVLRQFQGGSA